MNTRRNLPRPARSFVHIPDAWKQTGVCRSPLNRFEHETTYTDGRETLSESELLARGVACYRVQIAPFTVRDYPASVAA